VPFLPTGSIEGSGAKLGLGFKEEGAADLRSSTEELDFHEEPGTVTEREAQRRQERRLMRQHQQAAVLKYELEAQSEKERKDSACSDIGLLSISGRTSRLSSIGSGGSGASHISGMSHLSVMSGHSVASSGRSPSPHKMLLETSFCGSKPIPTQSIDIESPSNKHETESLEKALLSRQVDPTVAIVGDIRVEEAVQKKTVTEVREKRQVETVQKKSQAGDKPLLDNDTAHVVDVQKKTGTEDKALREKEPPCMAFRNEWQLRDRDEWGPHTKQKPVTLNLSEQGKKPITFSQLVQQQQQPADVTPSASPKPSRHAALKKTDDSGSRTPSPSSVSRKSSFTSLFKRNESGVLSPESPTVAPSKRKSSGFSMILKEASEGLRERSRSRSKSRERVASSMTVAPSDVKGKKDNKNKSVFSSLFKKRDRKKWTKTTEGHMVSPVDLSSPDQKLSIIEPVGNVEFTFNSDGNYQPSEYGMIRAGERQPRASQEHDVNVTRDDRVVWDNSAMKDDHVVCEDRAAKTHQVTVNDLSCQEDRVARADLAPQDDHTADVVVTRGNRITVVDLANQGDHVSKVDRVGRTDSVSKEVCLTKEERPPRNESLLPSESVMLPTLYQEEIALEGTSSLTLNNSQSQSMPSEDFKVKVLAEVPDSASITDHHSSESEKDSEKEYLHTKKQRQPPQVGPEEEDHERKGLVVQQDSFEDELPYVPTTLPQERSVAVPILPIKQRIAEVKTCPIERPRSTTPINPSLLEDYVQTEDVREQAIEKMRICLPREDSISGRAKSPRRVTKTWFEFAEQGILILLNICTITINAFAGL
jgi:curved DNA-binding protein CbpA